MIEPIHKLSLREQFNISRLAIQYPWLTLGFWIAVAVAGVLAFSSLKYALFPDITFPVVVVNAAAPLKTATETEQQLAVPIEQALAALPKHGDLNSTIYPGQAVVSLQFQVGSDLEVSSRQVADALKGVKLPTGATTKLLPINLNEAAVVSYAIESKSQTLEALSKTTKADIIPVIAQVAGVLKVNLLGEPVKFEPRNLAQPSDGQGTTIVRFNGNEALAIQVIKRGNANALEVVRAVEAKMQQLRSQFPTLQLTQAATQANYIEAATHETIQALIEAIVLSVIVIFPFLWNWRSTVISALAIPMSLLGTFIVMAIYGFNLETITLLALAMVIGSIVDDAIVDVENIARHLENGESPKQAAILATNEIGLTVTAATLTAVAVFLPVGMMSGVLGQFFKPFGITITAAMLTSLLVARTLSPLLAAYWLRAADRTVSEPVKLGHPQGRRLQTWFDGVNRAYRQVLRWSLEHRGIVVGVAVISFAIGLALIPLIPKGFIPKLDRGEFNITYVAPLPNLPNALQEAEARARQAAAQSPPEGSSEQGSSEQGSLAQRSLAQRAAQSSVPEIPNPLQDSLKVANRLDAFVRQSPQVDRTFTVVGSRQGEPNKGTIYVKLKDQRTIDTARLQDQFRQQLPQQAGVTTSIEDIQFVDTGGGKPVQFRIVGADITALDRTAQAIKTKLATIPGLEDLSTTADDNTRDVVTIRRNDGQRIAEISANLGGDLTIGEVTDRAIAEIKPLLPAGVSLQLGGDSAQVDDILSSFGQTLALSVLCIVLVLFLLFKSWLDTVVIFLALPLSIVGAMIGLLVAQSDFGMISLIGIIFLLGLTNKNAILIVDYIKQLRRSGKPRRDAILEAGPVRLRPILMTTAATILGMLPLALGLGAGAELRAPMAVAIMGGLVTSTLLSLIVVPVLYDLLDDVRWKFRHKR